MKNLRISKKNSNFAAIYSVYAMIRHMIDIKKLTLRALCVFLVFVGIADVCGAETKDALVRKVVAEYEYASINASKPTVVQDTVYLRVQDGWNYIQLPEKYTPAMIAYLPDTEFGPIPAAYRGIDEKVEGTCVFLADMCVQGWIWQLGQAAETQLVTIEAHEEATIVVMPTIPSQQGCTTKTDSITEKVCEKYYFGDEWRRESGEYTYTFKTVEGCDSIVTLHLTVGVGCGEIDTIYYCKGMNTDHQEGTHWYQKYTYESPATWFALADYMVQGESGRTLMNLGAAEKALRNHYVGNLTPVDQIIWSHRNEAATNYSTVEVANEAQWIDAGVLAMRVLFLCGESYSSDFTTDVANVDAAQMPVKKIENGQVVIIRGGERYTILGTKVQ